MSSSSVIRHIGELNAVRNQLFVTLQKALPHHFISRGAHYIAESEQSWIKNQLISLFIKYFKVNMQEAEEENPVLYESFNAFFTRKLKVDVRPLPDKKSAIISPVDGTVSQIGDITENNRIIQAKKHHYNLNELLGDNRELSQKFRAGRFATIYLAPKDYHRVHMPVTGTLRKMIHVPGRLFSVNQVTADHIPNLFARNERVIFLFDTAVGPLAMIMVGAMVVGSVETVWHGTVTPKHRGITTYDYYAPAQIKKQEKITLQLGEEVGCFKLGSTVIMLFAKESMRWLDNISANSTVQMGQVIGDSQSNSSNTLSLEKNEFNKKTLRSAKIIDKADKQAEKVTPCDSSE